MYFKIKDSFSELELVSQELIDRSQLPYIHKIQVKTKSDPEIKASMYYRSGNDKTLQWHLRPTNKILIIEAYFSFHPKEYLIYIDLKGNLFQQIIEQISYQNHYESSYRKKESLSEVKQQGKACLSFTNRQIHGIHFSKYFGCKNFYNLVFKYLSIGDVISLSQNKIDPEGDSFIEIRKNWSKEIFPCYIKGIRILKRIQCKIELKDGHNDEIQIRVGLKDRDFQKICFSFNKCSQNYSL